MNDWVDLLGKATVFYKLDANRRYWQFGINDVDEGRTAFKSHRGFYCIALVPLGLCNAPESFQRTVELIIFRVKCQFPLVYPEAAVGSKKFRSSKLSTYAKSFCYYIALVPHTNQKRLKLFRTTSKTRNTEFAKRRLELSFCGTNTILRLQSTRSPQIYTYFSD